MKRGGYKHCRFTIRDFWEVLCTRQVKHMFLSLRKPDIPPHLQRQSPPEPELERPLVSICRGVSSARPASGGPLTCISSASSP